MINAMRIRPRRNRSSAAIRDMVRESSLAVRDLVQPFFVMEGKGVREEIPSLPGNHRLSEDTLLKETEACMELGLRSVILFPAVAEPKKDSEASYAYDPENFYLRCIESLRKAFPELCIITDVAMDPYSSDGHDGIVRDGRVVNDETLPVLGKMALAQAEAGASMIGPSDMMDGRVGFIRDRLDDHGYEDTPIMAYTAKYASAFYGPFRDALDSSPKGGDKKSYQMDPGNAREAMREGDLDEEEGADCLMVKPALNYLDVIHRLKERSGLPVAAYHVSGEVSMLKAAAEKGWLDHDAAMKEALLSIRRAGADVIISYMAREFAASR